MKISLLTGGDDPNYAFPLSASLVARGVLIDFIGNDDMQRAELMEDKNINYLNLRGDQKENVPLRKKILRIMRFYYHLFVYAAKTDSQLFHILWLNKFVYIDRTLVLLYYKILGKKIIFTAHNINAGERDGNDSILNRITLKFLYKNVDHIFVHTKKMREQLIDDFNVDKNKITTISFGINTLIPKSEISSEQAKEKLNLTNNEKVLLTFGRITRYKGIEYLISAMAELSGQHDDFRLIIAGKPQKGCVEYWEQIKRLIRDYKLKEFVIQRAEFIPDDEIELYFKAADVLVLPYRHIYQSGPLFMAYNFGLPVIAADVGSFREDILEGKTGFICKPEDPRDMADKIELYFKSELYRRLEENRKTIISYANERYSWQKSAKQTCSVYRDLLKKSGRKGEEGTR